MNDLTDLRIFIATLLRPIIDEAIKDNLQTVIINQLAKDQLEPDHWFDLNELVEYDPEKRSKATFYGYIHNNTVGLPYHKRGKKLIFLKSEIDLWIKSGRKLTSSEAEAEATKFLSNKKKGK